MEDFRLKNSVSRLEKEVDILTKTVYNLKQQMSDALEQIKRLKEAVANDDCK